MQSKRGSFIEVATGTAVAFIISLLVQQYIVDPLWHLHKSLGENLSITVLFTVVSVGRSYAWRRFFNWLQNKNNNSHGTHWNHG